MNPKQPTVLALLTVLVLAGCQTRLAPEPPPNRTVFDVLNGGQFSTFASLIVAADLQELLRSSGPITVFAPTDQAFASYPKETLGRLQLAENREMLRTLMLNHIIDGEHDLAKLSRGGRLAAASGQPWEVQSGPAPVVAKVPLRQPQIRASNGVVHAIDQVLGQ